MFDFLIANEDKIMAEQELDSGMYLIEQQAEELKEARVIVDRNKRKLIQVEPCGEKNDENASKSDNDDEPEDENESDDENEWKDRFRDSDYEQDDDDDLDLLAMSREYQWHEIETQLGKIGNDATEIEDDKDSDDDWEVGDDYSEDELMSQNSSGSDKENCSRPKSRNTKRFVRPKNDEDVVFEVGLEFINRKEFQYACRHHGVMAHRKIRIHKVNPKRCTFRCRTIKNCPWMVSANFRARRSSWVITSVQASHKCTPTFKHYCCNYRYISERYKSDIQIMPEIKISALQQKAQKDLNVSVSRSTCNRAIQLSLKEILGDYRKQYTMIRDYCNELLRSNPNSTVNLQVTEDSGGNQFFRRLYICFDACKRGFIEGCRHVIGIDGCHLKGPHHGILLAAIGIDSNDQIFPVAYAVVENENKSSWHWFLGNLQEDIKIQNSPDWTIMSDKQKGIKPAVQELFLHVEHRFCTWHMYNNFKGKYSSLELNEMVWAAAKCTDKNQFKVQMNRIKETNPGAYQWLEERTEYSEWSRAHFNTGSKCDILVNNIVECFNKVIGEARDKPLLTMLEAIRFYFMDRHHKKRVFIDRLRGDLGPKVRKKLEKNMHESNRCFAIASGDDEFQVRCGFGELYEVKLNNRTCGCKRWDLTGIPCAHAIAAISLVKEEPEAFVSHWYSKEYYKRAYKYVIHPINGPDLWDSPGLDNLLPNIEVRIGGRPPKARKKSANESKKMSKKTSKTKVHKLSRVGSMRDYTCSHCKQTGHTVKMCPMRDLNGQPCQARPSQATTKAKENEKKEKKVRGCGKCGQPGHYKTSCTSSMASCLPKN